MRLETNFMMQGQRKTGNHVLLLSPENWKKMVMIFAHKFNPTRETGKNDVLFIIFFYGGYGTNLWQIGPVEGYKGRVPKNGIWLNMLLVRSRRLEPHVSWRGPKLKKKHPSFLLMPNSHKLRKDSKNVNFKIGPWGPKKLSQIFNMPIMISVPRKGQNTPKSDFRGPKIPPRGANLTWNM